MLCHGFKKLFSGTPIVLKSVVLLGEPIYFALTAKKFYTNGRKALCNQLFPHMFKIQ